VERVANKTRARVSNKHILLLIYTSAESLNRAIVVIELSGYNLEKEI
jgi:hypothetical protein